MHLAKTVLALFLATSAVETRPQATSDIPTTKTHSGKSISSESLLRRGYLLSEELPPDERVFLLTELIMPSSKWHPGLMRPWTEELFRLALQLSRGYDRVVTQKNAATAMSWIDIQRGLQMLDQCETPSQTDSDAEDVRDMAARTIFRRYWQTAGMSGLSRIQRTANHIAETGEYPYGAMVPVIQGVGAKDPTKSSALISEAVTFYGRGSKFEMTNYAFVDFLKQVKPFMTLAMRRQALEALVKALTADSGEKEDRQWRVRVYTDKGVADFHTQNARLLFDILPMVREVDPEWAQRLVEQHQELTQADAARGKVLNSEGGVVFKNQDNPPSPAELTAKEQLLVELGRLNQIQEITAKDPNQALALAMSITDPSRHAIGIAYAAAGFGNHPDQALQMLNQSQQSLASMKKSGEKLDTYVAIAESAVSLRDLALARDAVENGFELGEQAYEESRKEDPECNFIDWDGQDAMQKLTEIGTRLDSIHMISRVQAIRDHTLQGYMLVAASRAIDENRIGGWASAFNDD
jgi:hypothetical protein